jgi:hypothetical protein
MNDLLEKYWNGQTSLKEEKELRTYFKSEKVAPEHEIYRSFFNTLVTEQVTDVGRFDAFAKVKQKQSQENRFIKRKWMGLAIAASFSLLFALGVGFYQEEQTTTPPDLGTYETPEEAREAALKMLELVSVKLNKGRSNMQPLNTLDSKTTSVLNLNKNYK